jgi:hypothetical protein
MLVVFKRKLSVSFMLLFIFIMNISIHAQNIKYLTIPDVFTSYCKESFLVDIYENRVSLDNYIKSTTQRKWIVYSDRNDNKLYIEPDYSLQADNNLIFMEPLLVSEVQDNWLHVHSLNSSDDLGWIHAKYVLLSNLPAVLTEKGGTKKAMILVSVSNINPEEFERVEEEMKLKVFYNHPKMNSSYYTGKSAAKFQIFYVLKKVGNMSLLSQADKLNSKSQISLKNTVRGWMPNFNITSWNHRVCYEPNYSPDIFDIYSETNNTAIPIFGDKCAPICAYIENGDITNYTDYIINNVHIKKTRQNPRIMRMPILDYDVCDNCNGVNRIATIANATYMDDLPPPPMDLLNVNLIFIVDATKSMESYYPAISRSIKRVVKNNNSLIEDYNVKLKYALILYRDYADGDKAYEVHEFTADLRTFEETVSNVVCQSKDRDIPEAQFQGIIKGMEELNPKAFESNIIILIGDAGNREKDKYNTTDVAGIVNKYNASLISFQTYYKNENSYRYYTRFVKEIIEKSSVKYRITKNEQIAFKSTNGIENTSYLKYGSDNTELGVFRMFALYTYANTEKAMSTDILEVNITNAMERYLQKIAEEIETISDAKESRGNPSPELCNYLRALYTEYLTLTGKYTPDEIKRMVDDIVNHICRSGTDVSATGLAKKNYYNKSYDNFYPVVFVSYNEKSQLEQTFRALIQNTSDINDFKDALIEQVMVILGEPDEANVVSLTLNQVWQIILNIPFKSNSAIGTTLLKDLNKPTKANYDFYDKFVESSINFVKKPYDKDSMFELAKQKFYWIPLRDFPGY